MSALEGETETFNSAIKGQSEEITALNQEIQAMDIQTAADLWNEVEDLRTDVTNINADFSGRFTSYDNQIGSLRRDLTENYNAHREIQSTAQQARSIATQAQARTMNTT
jgi:chromosome segregation ATPase